MSETADQTVASVPGEARPATLQRTIKSDSGLRGLAIIALVGTFFVGMAVFAWVRTRNNADAGRAAVATIDAPRSAIATDPTAPPSPAYQELVVAENAAQIDAAENGSTGAIVPPLMGGIETPVQPVAETPANTNSLNQRPSYYSNVTTSDAGNAERSRRRSDMVRAKVAALKQVGANWSTLEPQATTAGVEPAVTVAQVALPDNSNAGMYPPVPLPLVRVLPAIIEVGANSDYAGKVIARMSGEYGEIKLIGEPRVTTTGPTDRLVLQFDSLWYRGMQYDIEAFGVDPKTGIPAIKGETNRHILYNTLTQTSSAFLAGYGSGLGQQRLTVGTNGEDVFLGGMSTSSLLRQEGATMIGGQLGRMQYRRTTVTLPAGSMIGIVLIASPEPVTAQRGSNPSPAVATNAGAPSYGVVVPAGD